MRWLVLLCAMVPLAGEDSSWCRPLAAAGRSESFSGTLREGQRFEHALGRDLVFVLNPVAGGGWTVSVAGRRSGDENWAGVVALPLRGNYRLYLDAWHFREKPSELPLFPPRDRRFQFVLNAADHARVKAERDVLLWPGTQKPEAVERAQQFTARSLCGEGRLVLSDVVLGKPEDGRILSLRFRAEFRLPR